MQDENIDCTLYNWITVIHQLVGQCQGTLVVVPTSARSMHVPSIRVTAVILVCGVSSCLHEARQYLIYISGTTADAIC
jgi:hypothetical protein